MNYRICGEVTIEAETAGVDTSAPVAPADLKAAPPADFATVEHDESQVALCKATTNQKTQGLDIPSVAEIESYSRSSGGTFLSVKEGQIRYKCVDAAVGPGQKLSESPQVLTTLTLIDINKDREVLREFGSKELRQHKLMRVSTEAREQGGVLTQQDLGVLLCCDEVTIRNDIRTLRAKGMQVPTRGFVLGIGGPTLSAKKLAIQHWLEGKEPLAVAQIMNTSPVKVERYLQDFKRVCILAMKGLDEVGIAQATNLSSSVVEAYQAIYLNAKEQHACAHRMGGLIYRKSTESAVSTVTRSVSACQIGAHSDSCRGLMHGEKIVASPTSDNPKPGDNQLAMEPEVYG